MLAPLNQMDEICLGGVRGLNQRAPSQPRRAETPLLVAPDHCGDPQNQLSRLQQLPVLRALVTAPRLERQAEVKNRYALHQSQRHSPHGRSCPGVRPQNSEDLVQSICLHDSCDIIRLCLVLNIVLTPFPEGRRFLLR